MRLNQYLVSEGMNQAEFARQIEVCQATVHKWMYGKSLPSAKRIMQIHVFTDGQVTTQDWIDCGQIAEG